MEKTFIIMKPDAVERKLVGKILTRIEENDLSIVYAKKLKMTEKQASEHYGHIKGMDFYAEMINYFTSNFVIAMIIEGEDAIGRMREMAGSTTNPIEGTIRADFGTQRYKNLIHTSDSVESYSKEAARFFEELPDDILM